MFASDLVKNKLLNAQHLIATSWELYLKIILNSFSNSLEFSKKSKMKNCMKQNMDAN